VKLPVRTPGGLDLFAQSALRQSRFRLWQWCFLGASRGAWRGTPSPHETEQGARRNLFNAARPIEGQEAVPE